MDSPIALFRIARRDDLETLVAMLADDRLGRSREKVGETLDPAYLEAFDAIEDNPLQELLLLEVDQQIAGMLQLSFLPGLARGGAWRGQIEAVRIARAYRGQGLGQQLLNEAERRARQRGCVLLQLTTDRQRPRALTFYQRLGYADSHHGMKKALT